MIITKPANSPFELSLPYTQRKIDCLFVSRGPDEGDDGEGGERGIEELAGPIGRRENIIWNRNFIREKRARKRVGNVLSF